MICNAFCCQGETTLRGKTQEEVLTELVELFAQVDPNAVSDNDCRTIVQALLRREQLGTTAIEGVAVPHCKMKNVTRTMTVAGHHPHGVDWRAADGQPRREFFLILSPADQPGEHLKALQALSRHLRGETAAVA